MIGNIAQFWQLTRELDMEAIRRDFAREVELHVLGSDGASAERVARVIVPGRENSGAVQVSTLSEFGNRAETREDDEEVARVFVVAVGSALDSGARRVLNNLSIGEVPLLLVLLPSAGDVVLLGVPEERMVTFEPDASEADMRDRIAGALVELAPEAMLPLGRRHSSVREAVATHLIRDTSRVNAQFAALSSLPSVVPLVGGLVGNVADMLVLTKNQVILLFKLAGLYGRDLAIGRRLLLEVLPVVGGAFFWRTTARALAGLAPPIVSVLPKTIVAYSGTFVVGELARYYYSEGRAPSSEFVRQAQQDGMRLAKSVVERLRRPDRA